MSEFYNQDRSRHRVRAGMRWFGPEDPVTVQNIRQTPGVTDVITALHHIPGGEIWTETEIARRKIEVEFLPHPQEPTDLNGLKLFQWYSANGRPTGLVWETVESLAFTEDIKNGSALRDRHIDNFNKSLCNLGQFGIRTVIGNFMLVADWTRTGTATLHDGSRSLQYIHAAFAAFDIYLLKRHPAEQDYMDDGSFSAAEIEAARQYWETFLKHNPSRQQELTDMIAAGLPGGQAAFTLTVFRTAVSKYKHTGEEELRKTIMYFLDRVVPVARDAGIRLCCHSDDPSFSPFLGTPRTVGGSAGYKFLLDYGCGANFCIGSLMSNEKNRDITGLIREIADYGKQKGMSIDDVFPHIHLRPIETDGKNFREGHHAEHREELAQVVYTLVDLGWQGVFRPDHAPTSDHGLGRPGYDIIGRGYGVNLLLGLFEMAETIKAARSVTMETAIRTCRGEMARKKETTRAAAAAEAAYISRKTPFIKAPFYGSEQDFLIG